MNIIKKQLFNIFPSELKKVLETAVKDTDWINCEEIRIYNSGYIYIKINSISFVINNKCQLSVLYDEPYLVRKGTVDEIIINATEMSEYAYNQSIVNGYITIDGGHRIGICGKTVISDGEISTFNEYYSLSIRISKVNKMFDDSILKQLLFNNKISNLCVVSPPGYGKTTLIRDFTLYISRAFKDMHICVSDERNEICNSDIFNYPNISVISNCPKSVAYELIIRTLSPDIVVFDEIWCEKDVATVNDILKCGIKCIFSIHGKNTDSCLDFPEEWLLKPCVTAVLGKKKGTIEKIGRIE